MNGERIIKMANKHLPHDLAQMQSLPLEAKIIMTKQRIRQWYEYWDGMVYVGFSGGKDSTVLKHLVDSMYDDVPSVFVNTGLEYPEIQKFAMCQKNVVTVRPEIRFDEVIKKHGYPVLSKESAHYIFYGRKAEDRGDTLQVEKYVEGLKINRKTGEKYYFKPMSQTAKKLFRERSIPVSDACCLVMKKTPAKKYAKQTGRKPIIGTMACESKLRYQKWVQNGCNAFNTKDPTSTPLSFWTEQDIYHYIKKYNVPICSVYGDIVIDEKVDGDNVIEGQMNLIDYLGCYEEGDILTTTGCHRTGCIFCMFGCHLEKEPNRFQRLKETHPRQYEYCIGGGEYNEDGVWQPSKEGLGLGKVLDYINVPYE